jgi:hypothetical protein
MDEDGHRLLLGGCRLIGAVLQNGGDGLVGAGIEEKGAGAGGVEALWPVTLHKSENPYGGAKALFWVRARTACSLAAKSMEHLAVANQVLSNESQAIPTIQVLPKRPWLGQHPELWVIESRRVPP